MYLPPLFPPPYVVVILVPITLCLYNPCPHHPKSPHPCPHHPCPRHLVSTTLSQLPLSLPPLFAPPLSLPPLFSTPLYLTPVSITSVSVTFALAPCFHHLGYNPLVSNTHVSTTIVFANLSYTTVFTPSCFSWCWLGRRQYCSFVYEERWTVGPALAPVSTPDTGPGLNESAQYQ
jgi:hypothetical protein